MEYSSEEKMTRKEYLKQKRKGKFNFRIILVLKVYHVYNKFKIQTRQ